MSIPVQNQNQTEALSAGTWVFLKTAQNKTPHFKQSRPHPTARAGRQVTTKQEAKELAILAYEHKDTLANHASFSTEAVPGPVRASA